MHVIFAVLFFIGISVIALIVVGGWILMTIFRLIGRAFGGAGNNIGRPPVQYTQMVRCPRPQCLSDSPAGARFCRRCGQALRGTRVSAVRRVA